MNKLILTILLPAILLVAGCNQPEAVVDQELMLITSKPWKIKEVRINEQLDVVTNYSLYSLKFDENLGYTFKDEKGVEEKGVWKFNSNKQQFSLVPTSGAERVYIIVKLTADETILETTRNGFKDEPANFRYVIIPS